MKIFNEIYVLHYFSFLFRPLWLWSNNSLIFYLFSSEQCMFFSSTYILVWHEQMIGVSEKKQNISLPEITLGGAEKKWVLPLVVLYVYITWTVIA